MLIRSTLSRIACLRRIRHDKRGNILMMFAFALLPVTCAIGMAIDYTGAMRLQTRLNTAADAAALSATSLTTIAVDATTAKARAAAMFKAQVSGSRGLAPIDYLDPRQFDVTVNDVVIPSQGMVRTATVTYRGQSNNIFAGILGKNTLAIAGSAVATASTAPNVDFYVMMDMSPSMGLPTTTAGFTKLKKDTGCAFACHSTNDRWGAWKKNGTWGSLYEYARDNNIPLRVDAEKSAVQNLTYTAADAMRRNGATYRISLSTFHVAGQFQTIASLSDSYATARSRAGAAEILKVYSNNWLTSTFANDDVDTAFTDMFAQAMMLMPTTAGNGMRTPGNSPQSVMMLITDGMRDENVGGRKLGALPTQLCDLVKQRGIRIAILYTEYLPDSMTGDARAAIEVDWARANVVPKLPAVAPALQQCASPGLFNQVTTDGDVTAALNTLFQRSIVTSRLTK